MKFLLTYLIVLISISNTYGQDKLYLDYEVHGLGSGLGEIYYPVVEIFENDLQYTFRQKNGKYEVETYEKADWIDTIWEYDTLTKHMYFNDSSIDSITSILKPYKDSSYSKTNFGVRSGAIYYLSATTIHSKVKITMNNTFDSTAYQVVQIINPYLPEENKIIIPYRRWESEGKYIEHLIQRAKEEEKSKNKKGK